jgi:hypothetical protein
MGEYLAVNIFIAEPFKDRNCLEIFSFCKHFNLFTKIKNSHIILGMSATYS